VLARKSSNERRSGLRLSSAVVASLSLGVVLDEASAPHRSRTRRQKKHSVNPKRIGHQHGAFVFKALWSCDADDRNGISPSYSDDSRPPPPEPATTTRSERLKVTDEERRSAPGHLQAAFEYAEAPPGPEPVGVGSYFGPMMEFGDPALSTGSWGAAQEMAATLAGCRNLVTAPLAAAVSTTSASKLALGDRALERKKQSRLPRGRPGIGE